MHPTHDLNIYETTVLRNTKCSYNFLLTLAGGEINRAVRENSMGNETLFSLMVKREKLLICIQHTNHVRCMFNGVYVSLFQHILTVIKKVHYYLKRYGGVEKG